MDPHNTGSATKPPMLVRNEYNIWQRRMIHSLSQQNTGCWKSVVFGPHNPILVHPETKIETPKDPKDYTDENFQKLELDAKAFSCWQWLFQMKYTLGCYIVTVPKSYGIASKNSLVELMR